MDFFLGAGASIQAGIPTGNDFTWMFKRDLYCSEQDILKERFKDIQSPRNPKILQEYFDSKENYPKLYDDKEYSFYFGKCYSTVQARQTFISNYVDKANPSLGHLCLANFIITDKVKNVWTTNFDKLIESGVYKLNDGNPGLAVARSLGDCYGHECGVSEEPQVSYRILEDTDEFIVMG